MLKRKIDALIFEAKALKIALSHPGVPWYAKAVIGMVIFYALSPIDLIPDFIPVLGYLDDLLILPVGVALAIRLTPKEILEECREEVRKGRESSQ